MPVVPNTDIPLPSKSKLRQTAIILVLASLYLTAYAQSTSWNTVWLIVFALSFLFTTAATALLYRYAKGESFLPEIRMRDVHTVKKPRIGGVAMWLGIMATFFWIVRDKNFLQFGSPMHYGVDNALWGIIVGMTILLIVGLIDDIYGLAWSYQLIGQYLATLALIVSGVTVSTSKCHLATFST